MKFVENTLNVNRETVNLIFTNTGTYESYWWGVEGMQVIHTNSYNVALGTADMYACVCTYLVLDLGLCKEENGRPSQVARILVHEPIKHEK